MTEPLDRLLRQADGDSLKRKYSWDKRLARIEGVLTILCVLAGIWLDWRWLVTAIIPLILFAASSYGMQQSIRESARRLEAKDGE